MQDESAQLERQVRAEHERSVALQRDLAASLRDSKEALHREVDIMAQLEAQDEVRPLPFPCAAAPFPSCIVCVRSTWQC